MTETPAPPAGAKGQVTALYQAHATGLVRLAMLMLGDQSSAEDVVQDAFFGLYRRWDALGDPGRAVAYARASVLNGCRDVLRRRSRKIPAALVEPPAESAEARVLLGEEHREVLAALPNGAPRYHVALSRPGTSKGAPVRNAFLVDTGTGKRLATLNPPSDALFTGVAASADDKTFVLDAVAGPGLGTSGSSSPDTSSVPQSHIFFVARLTPGTAHQARLTRVPIAASFTHTAIEGLAVSPDGRTLAIMFWAQLPTKGTPGPETLRTYSLATGQELRTWTEPVSGHQSSAVPGGDNWVRLSWLGDGRTLAFAYSALGAQPVVRTVRTNSPGTDLISDSQPVFTVPAGCYLPLMTSDGQAVICGAEVSDHGCVKGQPELTAYSVATGKLERVLYRYQGGDCISLVARAEWAGSGTLAIGNIVISRPGVPRASTAYIIGVISSGTFTSLPLTPTGGTPGSIAF
jgi:hypothetical protein